ncbi:MFS transporter [Streptomyces sp. NPDC003374]
MSDERTAGGSSRRTVALASSVAGAVVVALDGTVLTVAQPALQHDLGASLTQVQWTSTGYLVAVAALLVFAGRLGDRYGHRRLFVTGMLGFGAASAGAALAPGVGSLIGLRVAQGVCGALLQPATLGMLRAAFPPERLAVPIAVRTAAIALAAAAGPVLGGALATALGWRAVFLLNVGPCLVFGLLATALPRPGRPRATARVPLGLPGALLLAAALGGAVHTLAGLPHLSRPGLAVTVLAGAAFVRHERRAAHPLLPKEVIGSTAVASALGMLVAASAALSGTLFVTTYVLQDGLGLTPLATALRALPLAALMVAAAPVCPVWLRRYGARRTAVAATAVLALGVLVLAGTTATPAVCGGFALVGAGFGTAMVAATQVIVRTAAVASAGVAGGLQQTAMNVGPALGVAAAATLRESGGPAGLPLVVLGGVAAAGALAGRALPGRAATAGGDPSGLDPSGHEPAAAARR